jgi:hypothetical protein
MQKHLDHLQECLSKQILRSVLKSSSFLVEKVARRKLNYMQQFSEEALSDFRRDIVYFLILSYFVFSAIFKGISLPTHQIP